MSAAEAPLPMIGAVSSYAIGLERQGYLPFPLRHHSKIPATRNGFKDATNDPEQVEKWFGDADYNLGLATGRQPNGVNLVVIDLDRPKPLPDHEWTEDGVMNFRALCKEHGIELDPNAPMHMTPNGGVHLFFDGGDVEYSCSSNQLAPGVDVRATGGYIACPPSTIVQKLTGELKQYGLRNGGLWGATPIPKMPPKLGELLLTKEQAVQESVRRHPRQPLAGDDEGPAGYIRRTFDWDRELNDDGCVLVQVVGNDERYHRLGSENHHAIELHDRQNATLWTGNLPPHMYLCARTVRGGFWQINAWEYYCGKYHGGDMSAAGRFVRKELMPPPARPAGREAEPEAVLDDTPTPTSGLHYPEPFWSTDILRHIYEAAKHEMVSPEAMLLHVMTRFSASVHPDWKLSMRGTLDLMAIITGASGSGKSAVAKAARELYPGPVKPEIMYDRVIGSGEGLVEAFMVNTGEKDPETGKPGRKIGRDAIHFITDEGTTLLAQSGRDGATIVPTMCSAWAGEPLGQTNADQARNRHIPAGRVRMSAVINMQNGNAHLLYTERLRTIGFTGRMVFATVHDHEATHDGPPWPGLLKLPNFSDPPVYSGEIRLPDEAIAEIRGERIAVQRGELVRDERESQRLHQMSKLAGTLALMHGRQKIDLDDWERARTMVAASAAVLADLDHRRRVTTQRDHDAALTTKINDEIRTMDAKQAHLESKNRLWVLDRIKASEPEGIAEAAMLKGGNSDARRGRREAVDNLLAEGAIVRIEQRLHLH